MTTVVPALASDRRLDRPSAVCDETGAVELSAAMPRLVTFLAPPAGAAARLAGRVAGALVVLDFGKVALAVDAVVGTVMEGLSGDAIDGLCGDVGRAMNDFAGFIGSLAGEGNGSVRELFERGDRT